MNHSSFVPISPEWQKNEWRDFARSRFTKHWSIPWISAVLVVVLGAGTAIAVVAAGGSSPPPSAGSPFGLSATRAQGSGHGPEAAVDEASAPATAVPDQPVDPPRIAPAPRTAGTSAPAGRPSSGPPVSDEADPEAAFSISCRTDSGLIVCEVVSLNGFSGAVDLACESPYENLPCSFLPPSVTVPHRGSASSTLQCPSVGGIACIAPNPVVVPALGSTEFQMGAVVPAGTPVARYRFDITYEGPLPPMYVGTWFTIDVVQ